MAIAKIPKQKVAFSFSAPQASTVWLVGDFTDWEQSPIPLKKSKAGVWSKTVSLPSGWYEYRYLVDGQWRDDPECLAHVPNVFGSFNCVRVVLEPTPPTDILLCPANFPSQPAQLEASVRA